MSQRMAGRCSRRADGRGIGIYTQKLGMWVFLASEVMFFTALIGSYIILRLGRRAEWAVPQTVLNVSRSPRSTPSS